MGTFTGVGVGDVVRWTDQPDPMGERVSQTVTMMGLRVCPNPDCTEIVFVEIQGGSLVLRSFPPELIDFDSSNIPARLLAPFQEALSCHAAGCFRAAALMIRRTLEELCADKQASGKNLHERIASLGRTIIMPNALLQAADQLRLLGNDAAHLENKVYDKIEKEEVDIAIELTKELLKSVYQLDDLVNRMRALSKTLGS